MPTRHLTEAQRQSFARFDGAPSPEQLARYFHLDEIDRRIIKGLRRDHNRLGFALMLGGARFLGVFPDARNEIPACVLATLSEQLDLKQPVGLTGYFKGSRRVGRLALIRDHFGFSDFGDNARARFRLARWLYTLCWSGDDRPGPLIDRAASWLVVNKVLLPGITVLERFTGTVRDRAKTRLWHRLVTSLSADQRARIGRLFDDGDSSAFAALDALRTVPTKRTPTEFLRHLDRLDAVRAFDLRPAPPSGIPAATIERLARVARVSKPSAIMALQEPRRTATIAALFHTLEAAAQDDAAELAEALLTDLVKDAEAAAKQGRVRSLRDLDAAAMLLREMGLLVMADGGLPLDTWREALFQQLPRAALDAAMAKIEMIAKPSETKPYAELRARWRRARRLFFNIASRIETDATPSGAAVKAAIDYLKASADWSGANMRDAPTAAVAKAWRQFVLDRDGKVSDPRAYVFAVLDAWRGALKRRDVFAKPGIRYGDPRHGMLAGQTWQETRLLVCRALGRSLDAAAEVDGLRRLLDETYHKTAGQAVNNPDLRFEEANGKSELVMTPLDRLDEPDSLQALRPAVQARMPRAGITDIFLEVMARTGFTQAFTHLSERQARVENFEISLCAALVGEAFNIGLEPLVRPEVPALRRDRLSWIGQNFIRPETISAANAMIVAAHSRLAIVGRWGAGEIASADGMRFAAPTSAIHAGPNPKYFGQARGVTWYNMISNQFSSLSAIVVPGTLRDSLMVLALLLEQETENAIIHWNAIYMQEALRQLQDSGAAPAAADIARLSPVSWRHINFLGRYEFSLPEAVANGGLRPLKNPNSEWDF